jgi:hypothetical protein
LSPSRELLKIYKDKKEFSYLEDYYLKKYKKLDVIEICREITHESIKGKTIILLC